MTNEPIARALLLEARRRSGLSQVETAMRAGVSQSMIAAYETGRREPTIPTLERLLEAVGAHLQIGLTDIAPIDPPERPVKTYRPMTLDDLARHLSAQDDVDPWLLVAEFLTEYGFEDKSTRPKLLARRPRRTGSARFDALIAALGEHLALSDDVDPPKWVEDAERFLDQFWFPTNTPDARADAVVFAPASFVRRGVFVERESLVRV